MTRLILFYLVLSGSMGVSWAQRNLPPEQVLQNKAPDARMLFGADLLSAGADALRMGRYDDGIRLTLRGLEKGSISSRTRAAAHSNLCAAYAAKREPDIAIEHCTLSIEILDEDWHPWSNRAYAYWLKGMYPDAQRDLEAAIAINPDARQVFQIRGMLNEKVLRPNVESTDHQ